MRIRRRTENSLSLVNSVIELRQEKLNRRQIIIITSLSFMAFCASTCFSLLAPFFPYEAKQKGASDTVIGLLFGCLELVIVVASPLIGKIQSKIGIKFTYISGLFITGSCIIMFGFVSLADYGLQFIVVCFVVRSVEAVGIAAYLTASFAIIAAEFPTKVSVVFGIMETCNGVGLTVGPTIGGALYEAGGFKLPFIVLGGVTILFVGIGIITIEDDATRYSDSLMPSGSESGMSRLLRIPIVLVVVVIIATASSALAFLNPTLSPLLEGFDLSPTLIGLVFLAPSGTYALASPLVGLVTDRGYPRVCIVIGSVFAVLAFSLLGPTPFLNINQHKLLIIVISLTMVGLSVSALLIPTFSMLLTAAKRRGFPDTANTFSLISGLFNSAFSLGAFGGPILMGGYIYELVGFPWASTAVGGSVLFAMLLLATHDVAARLCCRGKTIVTGYKIANHSNVNYDSISESRDGPTGII